VIHRACDCCIPLARKLLPHQTILQPSAIPAQFSIPMDPPASAFQSPRAPRAKAKKHGGMRTPTSHPSAPRSLPPDIPGPNQLLLLILPLKTSGNHPSLNRQTGVKRSRMPSLPGRCLCPLDRATPGCRAQSRLFRQLSCPWINCSVFIAEI